MFRSPLSRSSLNLLCRRNCNVAPLAQLGQRLREIFVLLVPLRLTLRLSLRDTTSGPSKRSRFIPWENVRENISINGHCACAATAASRSLVFGVLPSPPLARPGRGRSVARLTKIRQGGREGGSASALLSLSCWTGLCIYRKIKLLSRLALFLTLFLILIFKTMECLAAGKSA